MAIIVEDGTIVSSANSYASEAELTTFFSNRNLTLSGDYTNEQLLLLAMDYIESLQFKGVKRTREQTLQWPRLDVHIDGYYNNSDTIPTELKNGLMQTAVAIDQGNNPQQTLTRKVIRERVEGAVDVSYSAGSSANDVDPKIMGFLFKLLSGGAGGNTVRVGKG